MTKQIIKTDQAPAAIGPYEQAIREATCCTVPGKSPSTLKPENFYPEKSKRRQEKTLNNVQAILKAAGMDMTNVVKTNVYLADMNHFARMNEVYAKFFGESKPARACVQVAALPKGAKVEIDIIAAD